MLSALLLAALLPLASATPTPSLNSQPSTLNVASPAPADTQCSSLTQAPDGTLHLTYYGPAPADSAPNARTLWHATLAPNATAFSTPRPIVTTPLLMENWADFATLAVGTDGALTAQWFQKSAPDAHGYNGWFSRSADGGRTWRTPARLGHEFVALAPLSQGRTLAVWLESTRQPAPHAAPRPPRAGETNAGTHDLGRALDEAADLNEWFNVPSPLSERLWARTASFCTERSGLFDGFDQGLVFFTANQAWLQPPGYVHAMITQTYGDQALVVQYVDGAPRGHRFVHKPVVARDAATGALTTQWQRVRVGIDNRLSGGSIIAKPGVRGSTRTATV